MMRATEMPMAILAETSAMDRLVPAARQNTSAANRRDKLAVEPDMAILSMGATIKTTAAIIRIPSRSRT
ncbi:hypothetical protein D3C71_2120990 [compost metagenome]